ncbi:hypothetical protein QMK33_15530 [Hymenobacter sp. H14-R3]|uniref:hypothetical protein n=1 Tax=Hymenobacter sp. H14-R3 TaxID=3046308 RepID=UPI0024B99846|nr:hypothetical protein [Hymenobacter sp. H14-R3]MDJ0366570.1 hypothetical protein [Hymenobacter sp. H14-R3]
MKSNIADFKPLRPELKPQLSRAEQRYPRVLHLIAEYDAASDHGDEAGLKKVLEQLKSLTGKPISESDLFEYYESGSKEELAFRFSLPPPVRVENITQGEVIELVNRLTKQVEEPAEEWQNLTFAQQFSQYYLEDYYYELLKINCPKNYNYSYFTRQKRKNGTYYRLTPAEIIARFLA